MPDYPHKLLRNPQGTVIHFDAARGFDDKDDNDEEQEEVEKDYERQKEALRQAYSNFSQNLEYKYSNRTLNPSFSIDYIRIDFFVTFANTIEYSTKDIFEKRFGLHPIRYYNFNKSVLFEIANTEKFNELKQSLNQFIDSDKTTPPDGQPYNIVTLIQNFTLLTKDELFHQSLSNITSSAALQLTHQTESVYREQKQILEKELISFIQKIALTQQIIYRLEDGFLLINGLNDINIKDILGNFDIVASVQVIRFPRIAPGLNISALRAYDFTIIGANHSLPKVVVIDSGISQISPLRPVLITNPSYSFDPFYPPYRPAHYHGTAVAVIAAVGEQFFDASNRALTAHCQIASYRVFENDEGIIDLLAFENNIRDAASKRVKLFNLSLNLFAKSYNGNYSYFSYLLDKLSYELDILFFISAGNLNADDLFNIYDRMQRPGYSSMLDYPAHYFSPEETCNEHSCEATNLKEPAESLNNLTIGALAENLNDGTTVDLSLDKISPAYYTSKYHVSPFHKVNGSRLKIKHINFRLFKPDIVYPGGDYGAETAGMQVSGIGTGNDFYRQECGTSFATPFATNLAARIAHKYPGITVQSIKALIINSSSPTAPAGFLEMHLRRLKDKFSMIEFGKRFSSLMRSEILKINKWFHKEDLLKRLTGHGKPDPIKALSSDSKSITVILEDTIRIDTHKAIPIHLPRYLNAFSKSKTLVNIDATLCYKFQPDFNEQMGYNPLHISFNFIKTFSSPDFTAKVAAYRNDEPGMNFYAEVYRGLTDAEDKNKARKSKLGVKKNIETWSDDFYPNVRQFSNTQKLNLKVNINDLIKTGNELSLIVRCTGKSDAPYEVKNYLNGQHPFSIVLTFSELGKDQFHTVDFYEKFTDINQTADIIGSIEAEADDLEADV